MEVFTKNGKVKMDENGTLGGSNHSSIGYNVPVNISLSFHHKKVYKYNKKDTITGGFSFGSFSKLSDGNKNFSINNESLERAGITQKQLDSIFEFSPDIQIMGKKLQIDHNSEINNFLKTNTSSFKTKGYLSIKSSNWFFTFCQFIKNYVGLLMLVLIFYQLKSIFKGLKEEFVFSLKLAKKIKWVGLLFIIQQLLSLILSVIFGTYYGYAGFEKMSNDVQLNINPRLEFDFTLIIVGLGLIVLSVLLQKGNEIQQENKFTI
jgi:hypothetical protein